MKAKNQLHHQKKKTKQKNKSPVTEKIMHNLLKDKMKDTE